MIFPSVSARSAPCLTEPSTSRRSTAAADPILTPGRGHPVRDQCPGLGKCEIQGDARLIASEPSIMAWGCAKGLPRADDDLRAINGHHDRVTRQHISGMSM